MMKKIKIETTLSPSLFQPIEVHFKISDDVRRVPDGGVVVALLDRRHPRHQLRQGALHRAVERVVVQELKAVVALGCGGRRDGDCWL